MSRPELEAGQEAFDGTRFYRCDGTTLSLCLFRGGTDVAVDHHIVDAPIRDFLTVPVRDHVLPLVVRMTVAPGKRTLSAASRVIGLGHINDFARDHQVFGRARLNSAAVAPKLLPMILDRGRFPRRES